MPDVGRPVVRWCVLVVTKLTSRHDSERSNRVQEGHYSNEDEVVADALRLMQARDDVAQIKRARLKDAIERGYDDVSASRTIVLETEDQIDAFFAEL